MDKITSVLNTIKTRAFAKAVVLTTDVGLVVEGVAEEELALDAIAAYAATYASASAQLGKETHFGAIDSVVVIYQGSAMVVTPVDASIVVAAVGSAGAQLGNMRHQLRRGIEDLERALREDAQAPLSISGSLADERSPQTADRTAAGPQDAGSADHGLSQHPNGETPPIPQDAPLKLD